MTPPLPDRGIFKTLQTALSFHHNQTRGGKSTLKIRWISVATQDSKYSDSASNKCLLYQHDPCMPENVVPVHLHLWSPYLSPSEGRRLAHLPRPSWWNSFSLGTHVELSLFTTNGSHMLMSVCLFSTVLMREEGNIIGREIIDDVQTTGRTTLQH